MKRLLIAGFALALLVPACALAQSAFDGSWKLDAATIRETHGTPTTTSMKNGVWDCKGCNGSHIKVKADGADHPVTGHPDYNTVAIDVINDHSVKEIDKQDGKVVSTSTGTVAADGKTATIDFMDDTGPKPASGTLIVDRIGKPVPDENAIAGRWKLARYTSLTDPSNTIVMKVVGNRITVGDEAGASSYTAEIGGKPVPFTHDGKPDGTVSVKRLGNNSLRATFEKDGKVTHTIIVAVAANGRTLKMTIHNPHTGSTTTMTHDKV